MVESEGYRGAQAAMSRPASLPSNRSMSPTIASAVAGARPAALATNFFRIASSVIGFAAVPLA